MMSWTPEEWAAHDRRMAGHFRRTMILLALSAVFSSVSLVLILLRGCS